MISYITATLAFLLGASIVWVVFKRKLKKQFWKDHIRNEIYVVAHHMAVLKDLRQGKSSDAVEFCESMMDYDVCSLGYELHSAETNLRPEIIAALESIAIYREQWPRKIEQTEKTDYAKTVRVAEEATKLLKSEFSKVAN